MKARELEVRITAEDGQQIVLKLSDVEVDFSSEAQLRERPTTSEWKQYAQTGEMLVQVTALGSRR